MAAPLRYSFVLGNPVVKSDLKRKLGFQIQRKLSTKEVNSYQFCVEAVRKYDYENYLCSLLLPAHVRSAALVIRSFNVELSQVRDLVSTSAIGQMRMQFWQDTLEKIFSGFPPEQPIAKELAKVLQKYKLSKTWFQRLITSRLDILNDKPFLSSRELEEYCDYSVSSIFFLILQTLGITNIHCDHAASHVGKSQGICNFIRGIPYNASKGRLFLPLELMSKHKLSQEDLLQGNGKKKLQDAVFELSTVAHEHLKLGRKLSKDVTDEAKLVFLPAVCIANCLKNLEKTDFDVFHPQNQRRNHLLPISLLMYKLRKKY